MLGQKSNQVTVIQARRRAQLSCDRCRVNKRKCDREAPCGRCTRDDAECTFQRANATKELTGKRRKNEKPVVQPTAKDRLASAIPLTSTSLGRKSSEYRLSTSITDHEKREFISVADIDVDSYLATAFKASHFSLNRLGSTGNFINRLIEFPFFLLRIFSLYINHVDWIGDLLKNTRIDRTIATNPCQPSREIPPILWDALQMLAYMVIAITAQMVPTEVEVILLDLQNTQKDYDGIFTADLLAQEAFHTVVQEFSKSELIESAIEWPPEHFAAYMMVHVYEKNSGKKESMSSSMMVAIEGLKQAGMYHEPFKQRRGVRHDMIMQQEKDLLLYRLFWSYFEKDRIRSWYSRSPARFGAEDCKICLRGEEGGHALLKDLLSDSKVGENGSNSCICLTNSQDRLPVLSKFSYMQAKIGSLIGRYYNLLASISQQITHENTDIARYLISDFDADHIALEKEISDLHQKQSFRQGQTAMLHITLKHIRTGFTTRLCELYVNKVFKDQYSISQQAMNWMLERRRNKAKIDLLEEGRKNCSSWVATSRCSWIFTPKFMHEQFVELIKAIEPWFVPIQSYGNENIMPMQWLKLEDFHHLIDCFDAVCKGRNTIVLMTRRNELRLAKKMAKEVCEMLHSFLVRTQLIENNSNEAISILNFSELIDLSQFRFSAAIQPCCLNNMTVENDLTKGNSLSGPDSIGSFTRSPPSSSLSTTPMTNLSLDQSRVKEITGNSDDLSVLSTLREISTTDLQKVLDAWNDDLDRMFGSLISASDGIV